jgi:hypothetical protein
LFPISRSARFLFRHVVHDAPVIFIRPHPFHTAAFCPPHFPFPKLPPLAHRFTHPPFQPFPNVFRPRPNVPVCRRLEPSKSSQYRVIRGMGRLARAPYDVGMFGSFQALPDSLQLCYIDRMALEPVDWNVVVLGRWNPALFTPAAISRRIFGLPEGTPVEVFVVLDDVQQPRVRHGGVTISPSFGQLLISPERCTFGELDRAREIAREAIRELPKTPFLAAGYNLRYVSDAMPTPLAARFSDALDRQFADNDFRILGRQFHRVLEFRNGRVLVRVTRDPDDKAEVLINFDLQSKESEPLREWLTIPVQDIRDNCERILRTALELQEDDYVFEDNEHADESPAGEVATGQT